MTLWPRLTISSLTAAFALYLIALPLQNAVESPLFAWLEANASGVNFIARYLTAVQYYDVIQVAVLSSVLILAFWASSRLLHVNVNRGITVLSLAAGSLLTVLSLADNAVVTAVGLTSYSRGFPLNWLLTTYGMGSFDQWVTGVNGISLLIDLLFWTGLASAGFFVGSRMKRKVKPSQDIPN